MSLALAPLRLVAPARPLRGDATGPTCAVVACASAPSAQVVGPLADTSAPGNVDGLLAPIQRARARAPDRLAALRFAAARRWEHAFAAELADLEAL